MPDKTKNKVLIIEDEQDIRTIYAEVLQNAGYVVDQAPNGEVGGDKIKNSEWSILLLDIMLPGKDGLKILKDLKETPELKKGPVIVLTNLNSEHIIQEAFKLGADGYLIKSEVNPDKVVEEVGRFSGVQA
ncbi:MAG: Histidine kinase [candidate division WWE3 bacterium GW2011_GWF2_41_45]|uniref:Response regulatory domain-containing protein n=3 Tax=Katanobacteria TaxID=422282 RepID=A0A1F4W2D9_UNCKA|nr:MAG: Histidine kinase [candidate division WWE3 bacterium GW2011_GWC2_41_23]KKS10527.1 MAG: Histidine kinase [candidate division WWE3 bacterium GW2011_GWF2_41_45]KKS20278.1 MAG: Histidine kinase [candidate division WWE3 bacterium GW2011_GWE1_41_72]KKS30280.1 MAG: Histidine kinase [candidate division WWE3 bacterium GW2011_GWD2_42_11]KKS51034.1 MAG: Histidine kinase [candidate division WWE3 bacterium GW2011_GWE2_42_25]KKS60303.1 MAG: Histidine kinase [candidate division WWE3 bacterium GW2011_G